MLHERFVVSIEYFVQPCKRIHIQGWLSVITARTLNPTLAKSGIHLLISHFIGEWFLFQEGSVSLLGWTFSRRQSWKLQLLWKNPLLHLVPRNYHYGIVQIFVNTFDRLLKHNHCRRPVFPEAIWQLSAKQLQQMLIFSRYSTKAVVVLSEEVYTFDMKCTVTLMRIVSKYWKI